MKKTLVMTCVVSVCFFVGKSEASDFDQALIQQASVTQQQEKAVQRLEDIIQKSEAFKAKRDVIAPDSTEVDGLVDSQVITKLQGEQIKYIKNLNNIKSIFAISDKNIQDTDPEDFGSLLDPAFRAEIRDAIVFHQTPGVYFVPENYVNLTNPEGYGKLFDKVFLRQLAFCREKLSGWIPNDLYSGQSFDNSTQVIGVGFGGTMRVIFGRAGNFSEQTYRTIENAIDAGFDLTQQHHLPYYDVNGFVSDGEPDTDGDLTAENLWGWKKVIESALEANNTMWNRQNMLALIRALCHDIAEGKRLGNDHELELLPYLRTLIMDLKVRGI